MRLCPCVLEEDPNSLLISLSGIVTQQGRRSASFVHVEKRDRLLHSFCTLAQFWLDSAGKLKLARAIIGANRSSDI
jgi:hypothetical protein